MRAMVLTGIRRMEMRELPDPHIRDASDVLIRVGSIGVCGSDVHYYVRGRIGSQVVQYPFRIGHEFAGVVEETGAAVTRVKPGDRVAVDPAMSCGQCDQCKAGRRNTCRNLKFLGCPGQADGCFCERIVMPADCCYPVGPGITTEQAALSEPLAIGVYAVRQSVTMHGASVGILGAGPIGLSVLLAARAKGARRLYVTDRIAARLAAATVAGAGWTGDPGSGNVVSGILADEPRGLDVVFECCGEQEALDQAIELLKPGGKLMIVGIPSVDRVSFSAERMRRKEVDIRNVRRQEGCVDETLELIGSGRASVDFMVTHRFDLAGAAAAMDLVADYRDGVIKAMVKVAN